MDMRGPYGPRTTSNVCSTLTISRITQSYDGFLLKVAIFTKCFLGSVRTPKPSSVTIFCISILGLTLLFFHSFHSQRRCTSHTRVCRRSLRHTHVGEILPMYAADICGILSMPQSFERVQNKNDWNKSSFKNGRHEKIMSFLSFSTKG